jgi:Zn-dependent peptidase ImmA (M78 family)
MLSDIHITLYANQLKENVSLSPNDRVLEIDNVIKKAGFKYMEENFNDDFSAFSKYLGKGDYLICFNKNHFWSEKFRRFTLAHELGHLSIPSHVSLLNKTLLHRSKPEYCSRDTIEIEADKFAINLLAPKITFINFVKNKSFNKDTINEVSEYFQVSTYAAALRFIEITDLSCVLIVYDSKGRVVYDKRSERFFSGFIHESIRGKKCQQGTLIYDVINNLAEVQDAVSELNYFYPELSQEVDTNESVLKLGYNDKIIVLIEPHVSSLLE